VSQNTFSLVGTLLRLWCERDYPNLRALHMPWNERLMHNRAIRSFVPMLEQMPFLDAAYWLSTAYADLSSEAYRTKLAMYFAPPSIANRHSLAT
jgi:adenine-specific DNA-methyltransferase